MRHTRRIASDATGLTSRRLCTILGSDLNRSGDVRISIENLGVSSTAAGAAAGMGAVPFPALNGDDLGNGLTAGVAAAAVVAVAAGDAAVAGNGFAVGVAVAGDFDGVTARADAADDADDADVASLRNAAPNNGFLLALGPAGGGAGACGGVVAPATLALALSPTGGALLPPPPLGRDAARGMSDAGVVFGFPLLACIHGGNCLVLTSAVSSGVGSGVILARSCVPKGAGLSGCS